MRTIVVALAVVLVTASSSTAAFVVTSKNIKNGTIQLVDISPQAKKALRGRQGPPGVRSVTQRTATLTIPPGGMGSAEAACPDGQAAISSGYSAPTGGIVVRVSQRSLRGWEMVATGQPGSIMLVHAYCSPGISG